MARSRKTERTCLKCGVSISGKAKAISPNDFVCLDCWRSVVRTLFGENPDKFENGHSGPKHNSSAAT